MRRATLALAVGVGGAVAWLAVLPTPVAAGEAPTETLVRTLSGKLLALGATIAIVFEAVLLYAVLRFRDSGDAASPVYNSRFHFAYVLAVGLVLFFVGFASLQTLGALDQGDSQPPEDAVRVNVVAQQWAWTFEYPEENVTSAGTVAVPANETVHLRLTSRDVIHAFYVPELALKRDANPARWNAVTFTPMATGEYAVKCAEYCGQAHSRMRGTLRVANRSAYENWLDERRENGTGS